MSAITYNKSLIAKLIINLAIYLNDGNSVVYGTDAV